MSDIDSNASEAEEEHEYEVERILAESTVDGNVVYLIKWLNYDDNQCTWEPAESFLTPDTLTDWQQQLANNDILDEDEVAGVQARMDAFQKLQNEIQVDQDPAESQSYAKRRQESPPTPAQPTAKRPRASSPAQTPDLNAIANPKKGITQLLRSDQRDSASSSASKPRTNSISIPASSNAKSSAYECNGAVKQRDPILAAASKLAGAKSPEVSTPAGSNKLSSNYGALKASHTKDLTGQRFRNLSHQNNYAKKARQEPAPDVSKLDLRLPSEWSSGGIRPTNKTTGTLPSVEGTDSPLVVPENEVEPGIHLEESPIGKDAQGNLDKDVVAWSSSTVAATPRNPALHRTGSVDLATPDLTRKTVEVGKHAPVTTLGNAGSPHSFTTPGSERRPPIQRVESRPAVVPRAPDSSIVKENAQQGTDSLGNTDRRASITRARPENQATSNVTQYAFAERRPPPVRRESHNPVDSERDGPFPPPRFQEVVNPHQPFKDRKVLLRFGAHDVGEVMLLSLPQWFSGKLNGIREDSAPLVNIYFQEHNVMDIKKFATVAQNLDKRQHGHFAVEANGVASTAIESLCQYLESNDLGAIWEYPRLGDSLILVMYSCAAPGWKHLGQAGTSNARLHVALLNKVPEFHLANDSVRSDQPIIFERDVDKSQPPPDTRRPQLQLPISDDAACIQSPIVLPTPTTAISEARDPTFPAPTPKSPGRQGSLPIGDTMIWMRLTPAVESQMSFSANFDRMVDGLDKQKRPHVFITFAKARPAEAQAVMDWLLQHLSSRYVFSDEQKKDWGEFRGDLSSHPSVILFHERYPCYCDIPLLYNYLRSPGVWCFNVSFRAGDESLSRLFPRGSVMCITEDTLLHNSEGALAAMKAFEQGSVGKTQSWKLVLPPDYVSWVLRQVSEVDDKVQKRHISMLETWYDLRKRSSEESPSKGRKYEDPQRLLRDRATVGDDQLVMSPKDLPGYVDWDTADMSREAASARDTAFLEYFVRWSAMNISKYRLFTVVDAKHTNKTEKQAWHICFRDPASYVQQENK